MKEFSEYIINGNESIRNALTKLNQLSDKNILTLFVVDGNNKMVGTVTDGDIRRGLLAGKELDQPVNGVMYTKFRFLEKGEYDLEKIANYRAQNIVLLPVLEKTGEIYKLISLKDQYTILPVEAILMAGGIGERLRPLTDVTPKPLLPVGNKPIIEHNIDRLAKFGVSRITISVRFMAEKIIQYLGDGQKKKIEIGYIQEVNPMGTIGSLKLLKETIHDSILVMNSDLLTNINYEDFYNQFKQSNAAFAIATIPYKINVPYAILDIEDDKVKSLKEKPTYTYYANAGIYLMKKEIINLIPQKEKVDATDLIDIVIQKGLKVMSYPILEYWLDIGNPEDYKKAQEDIKHLNISN